MALRMVFIFPGNGTPILPGAGAKSLGGVLVPAVPLQPTFRASANANRSAFKTYQCPPAAHHLAQTPASLPWVPPRGPPLLHASEVYTQQSSQEEPYKAHDPPCHSPKHPPMASARLTRGPARTPYAVCSRTSLTSAPVTPAAVTPPRQSGVSLFLKATVLMLPMSRHSSPRHHVLGCHPLLDVSLPPALSPSLLHFYPYHLSPLN